MHLDPDHCYAAVRTRDARFDGRFFTGVTSTGIFCRPICPARTPRPDRVRFFPSAAAAMVAGFRPCRRCRPDAAPGSPAWRGSATVVERALAAIEGGALDGAGTATDLASRLGVSTRHLRRLMLDQVGATPADVARTRRVLLARRLLLDTDLPVTTVAHAAGFGSVRQFNDVVRTDLGAPPSRVRARGGATGTGRLTLTLRLAARPPIAWDDLLAFLRPRALPDIETVTATTWERRLPAGRVRVGPAGSADLRVDVDLEDARLLPTVLERVRALADSDADTQAIEQHLSQDAQLAARIRACPGRRIAGVFDPWEGAVRVVLGQQISVAAATTLAGRLVAANGGWFPDPDRLPEAARSIAMPRSRQAALGSLAVAVGAGAIDLAPGTDLTRTRGRLRGLRGIGPWTTEVIALRVLRDPDAFPASDLGVRRALGGVAASQATEWAERLRPWRAYAVHHLWAPAPDPAETPC